MSNNSNNSSNNLQSLRYSNDDDNHHLTPKLSVLDQLLLPSQKKYLDIRSVEDAWTVIRSMQIRGAPLIAIVASLSLAVDLCTNETTLQAWDALEQHHDNNHATSSSSSAMDQRMIQLVQDKINHLKTSRPTAVNLFHAMDELEQAVLKAAAAAATKDDTASSSSLLLSPRKRICQAVVQHAEFMLQRDVSDNRAIGKYGAQAILQRVNHNTNTNNTTTNKKKITMVTICNTGSLATAGYGTALGVARALQEQDALEQIIALETRPYYQGSRLTAFEMVQEQMPRATLICDAAIGALMKTQTVDAVVVGADRVCANGDTANKIGTYNLAVVAAAHHVPFYVAAPFTTLDVSLSTGDDILIEQRPASELLVSAQAPEQVACWNPAFDVTPAKYIAGIITEKGMIVPQQHANGNGERILDVAAFVKLHRASSTSNGDKTKDIPTTTANHSSPPVAQLTSSTYQEQTTETLPVFLAQNAPAVMEALGTTDPSDLTALEMGDGNLNLVFIVTNNNNTTQKPQQQQRHVIVKQALPYVRCVGEAWPLTLERSYYEYRALQAEKEACPEFVPTVYYFSKPHGLMVMEYLAPPNMILRKGLIQGIRYPTMAADMGTFCAKTLFRTSGFKLSETELRQQVQFWSTNTEMCALTEQVVFTEPYIKAANNRWTSPQLDQDKQSIETDVALKVAAAKLKAKFVTETQALLHADLHSGSVMCSPAPGQTFVIDPEFAFYGPIGFDTGAFLGNLLLAYVSQAGHKNGEGYGEWILEQVVVFWKTFEAQFIQLWNDPTEHTGFLFGRAILNSDTVHAQDDFLQSLFIDTLSFAGMKMLRRIVGIAHVEDLESIEDKDVRAQCERHGLEIAKTFIKSAASSFTSVEQVIQLARTLRPN